MCQQAKLFLVALFGVILSVIYASDCSLAPGNILSDGTTKRIANQVGSTMMEVPSDVIRMHENPLQDNYEIWKLREKRTSTDYRSRRKATGDANKLKKYDRAAIKTGKDDEKLRKDTPIDYSYIDEYCKVSASNPSDTTELDSRPKQLKTNTAFGRSKMPFDKFSRSHIGGDAGRDCTLAQSLPQPVRCHQVDTGIRNGERGYETAPTARDYYENNEIPFRCCDHDIETAVDYCTCMFCVKGLFYHCTNDPHGGADHILDPCSCTPVDSSCMKRWSVLGVLAVFLPCLLCYPAASGCTEVCKCYREHERSVKDRQCRTVQNRERERLT